MISDEVLQGIFTVVPDSIPFLRRLKIILTVATEPIPINEARNEAKNLNKKYKYWSEEEDNRLFAGIHKFGFDSWASVAKFVGNGRSRAQCDQRWNRSLNPQIQKTSWSEAEDRRLNELVGKFGRKAWIRIAAKIVGRSDVQCRYRWRQMHPEAERNLGERNLGERNLGEHNLGERNLGERNLGEHNLGEGNLAEHNGAEDYGQNKPACGEVDAKGPHPITIWDRILPEVIELFPFRDEGDQSDESAFLTH
jgi:hypothetical protein